MNSSPIPAKARTFDRLPVEAYSSLDEMALAAAFQARECLFAAIAKRGEAAAILATGNSQLRFLEKLHELGGVDWSKVTLFHMDEYQGISADHPASFRHYLRHRVEEKLRPRVFHYVNGDAMEPIAACENYESLLRAQPIDLCCLGIGENGHLAFNDPPVANFADSRLMKIVKLDTACLQQQVNEGHFPSLEAVPPYALTLTIPALCDVSRMLCIVPEARKAQAIKDSLEGSIGTACPGSYLRTQKHCTLFLDQESSSLLDW